MVYKIYLYKKKTELIQGKLKKKKEMYMTHIYTPQNYRITWRDSNTWRDVNGNPLQLLDISEDEIKQYYFARCPRDLTVRESFIGNLFSICLIVGFLILLSKMR